LRKGSKEEVEEYLIINHLRNDHFSNFELRRSTMGLSLISSYPGQDALLQAFPRLNTNMQEKLTTHPGKEGLDHIEPPSVRGCIKDK
jgi:hypothetical protein